MVNPGFVSAVALWVFGGALIAVGITTGAVIREVLLEDAYNNILKFDKDILDLTEWCFDSHHNAYFWNMTNYDAVLFNNSKPEYDSLGPFNFTQWYCRVDMRLEEGDTDFVYFYEFYGDYQFHPVLMNGVVPTRDDDAIYTVNAGYLGVTQTAAGAANPTITRQQPDDTLNLNLVAGGLSTAIDTLNQSDVYALLRGLTATNVISGGYDAALPSAVSASWLTAIIQSNLIGAVVASGSDFWFGEANDNSCAGVGSTAGTCLIPANSVAGQLVDVNLVDVPNVRAALAVAAGGDATLVPVQNGINAAGGFPEYENFYNASNPDCLLFSDNTALAGVLNRNWGIVSAVGTSGVALPDHCFNSPTVAVAKTVAIGVWFLTVQTMINNTANGYTIINAAGRTLTINQWLTNALLPTGLASQFTSYNVSDTGDHASIALALGAAGFECGSYKAIQAGFFADGSLFAGAFPPEYQYDTSNFAPYTCDNVNYTFADTCLFNASCAYNLLNINGMSNWLAAAAAYQTAPVGMSSEWLTIAFTLNGLGLTTQAGFQDMLGYIGFVVTGQGVLTAGNSVFDNTAILNFKSATGQNFVTFEDLLYGQISTCIIPNPLGSSVSACISVADLDERLKSPFEYGYFTRVNNPVDILGAALTADSPPIAFDRFKNVLDTLLTGSNMTAFIAEFWEVELTYAFLTQQNGSAVAGFYRASQWPILNAKYFGNDTTAGTDNWIKNMGYWLHNYVPEGLIADTISVFLPPELGDGNPIVGNGGPIIKDTARNLLWWGTDSLLNFLNTSAGGGIGINRGIWFSSDELARTADEARANNPLENITVFLGGDRDDLEEYLFDNYYKGSKTITAYNEPFEINGTFGFFRPGVSKSDVLRLWVEEVLRNVPLEYLRKSKVYSVGTWDFIAVPSFFEDLFTNPENANFNTYQAGSVNLTTWKPFEVVLSKPYYTNVPSWPYYPEGVTDVDQKGVTFNTEYVSRQAYWEHWYLSVEPESGLAFKQFIPFMVSANTRNWIGNTTNTDHRLGSNTYPFYWRDWERAATKSQADSFDSAVTNAKVTSIVFYTAVTLLGAVLVILGFVVYWVWKKRGDESSAATQNKDVELKEKDLEKTMQQI